MAKKKLTAKEKNELEQIRKDLTNLKLEKEAIKKIKKELKDILVYNRNVSGPDLRYRHVTKKMKEYWDRGSELVSQAREKFRVLERFYKDSMNSLMEKAWQLDPTFKF